MGQDDRDKERPLTETDRAQQKRVEAIARAEAAEKELAALREAVGEAVTEIHALRRALDEAIEWNWFDEENIPEESRRLVEDRMTDDCPALTRLRSHGIGESG